VLRRPVLFTLKSTLVARNLRFQISFCRCLGALLECADPTVPLWQVVTVVTCVTLQVKRLPLAGRVMA
jgi:hypothetical protein